MSSNQFDPPDCTDRCKSTQHGDLITSSITKRSISDSDLCAYLNYICTCCELVRDSMGRTALHMAASCGRIQLTKWLIECRGADVNARDIESGYTPLHRSITFGQIGVALTLVRAGANIHTLDNDNLTILDYAHHDINTESLMPIDDEYDEFEHGEAFVWGSNNNNVLGTHGERITPELFDDFHCAHPHETIQQICLGEFHSVILTASGKLFSCGHGQCGRLGLGSSRSVVVPEQICYLTRKNAVVKFKQVSIARDHSLFLDTDGAVYTCGSNDHRVLGIVPPPDILLSPKKLPQFQCTEMIGVCTGRYHSIAWGPQQIFSWGLNAGQIGHRATDAEFIVSPKLLSLFIFEREIQAVSTCDGATAVCIAFGDIYVFNNFQCRKIGSRMELVEYPIRVNGGKLCLRSNQQMKLPSSTAKELKVVALANDGNLFLWQESQSNLKFCKCLFSINHHLFVTNVALNDDEILLTTSDGEAFKGTVLKSIRNNNQPVNRSNKYRVIDIWRRRRTIWSTINTCLVSVKLTRFSKIHRAFSITSDNKGNNYGVIQKRPLRSDCNYNTTTIKTQSIATLLDDSHESSDDNIHDLIIEIMPDGQRFIAHRYIIASRTSYFEEKIRTDNNNQVEVIRLDNIEPELFREFLQFIYTDKNGGCAMKSEKMRDLCGKFNVVLDQSKIKKNNSKSMMSFNRGKYPDLCDVTIQCQNGDGVVIKEIQAHKCILAGRVEYFRNLLSTRWRLSSTINNNQSAAIILLQFPVIIVEAFLDYLYTDNIPTQSNSIITDVDYYLKLIILADQLLVDELRTKCEQILADLITVKNVTQILFVAFNYNAHDLRLFCLDFIVLNLACLLESNNLLVNAGIQENESLLEDLNNTYFRMTGAHWHEITPYSTAPIDEIILSISSAYPVALDTKIIKTITSKQSSQQRQRSKSSIDNNNKSIISTDVNNHQGYNNDINVQFPDVPDDQIILDSTIIRNDVLKRLQAIRLANDIVKNEEIVQDYWNLSNDEFPVLNSPPQQHVVSPLLNGSKKLDRSKPKVSATKISQKARKRLISESNEVIASNRSNENPWKTLPILSTSLPSDDSSIQQRFTDIMMNERKEKENLARMTSKLLIFTQIEDQAIVDLERFYNVDNVTDEAITVERVAYGAVALPVWLPKTKTSNLIKL